jgi:hypothetical protein
MSASYQLLRESIQAFTATANMLATCSAATTADVPSSGYRSALTPTSGLTRATGENQRATSHQRVERRTIPSITSPGMHVTHPYSRATATTYDAQLRSTIRI